MHVWSLSNIFFTCVNDTDINWICCYHGSPLDRPQKALLVLETRCVVLPSYGQFYALCNISPNLPSAPFPRSVIHQIIPCHHLVSHYLLLIPLQVSSATHFCLHHHYYSLPPPVIPAPWHFIRQEKQGGKMHQYWCTFPTSSHLSVCLFKGREPGEDLL